MYCSVLLLLFFAILPGVIGSPPTPPPPIGQRQREAQQIPDSPDSPDAQHAEDFLEALIAEEQIPDSPDSPGAQHDEDFFEALLEEEEEQQSSDPWEFPSRGSCRRRTPPPSSSSDSAVHVALIDGPPQDEPIDLTNPSHRDPIPPSPAGDGPCSRHCTVCLEEDRQRRRIARFFQENRGQCNGLRVSSHALFAVVRVQNDLTNLTRYVDRFLQSDMDLLFLHAERMWDVLRSFLETLLVEATERVQTELQRIRLQRTEREQESARLVVCVVCQTALPTVALRTCGHVLCPSCSHRLFRCPVCRVPIVGILDLFFLKMCFLKRENIYGRTVAIALLGKGVWEESYGAPRRTPPPHVTIRHRSLSTREGSVGGVVCHHHMSPSAIALECGRSQGGGLLLSHWSPSRSSRPIRGLGYSGVHSCGEKDDSVRL
ncbi:hypothetical protein J6590_104126 [Homalodisca vitripennis]|nr:hypothetical protein J6590_104126 [Homalodisca vitripennis]